MDNSVNTTENVRQSTDSEKMETGQPTNSGEKMTGRSSSSYVMKTGRSTNSDVMKTGHSTNSDRLNMDGSNEVEKRILKSVRRNTRTSYNFFHPNCAIALLN